MIMTNRKLCFRVANVIATAILLSTNSYSQEQDISNANDVKSKQQNENYTISHQDELVHDHHSAYNYKAPVRDSTLLLVQVLFRHGDRSPLQSYPKDSHKDKWPQGYGQLTELGMTQGFELGQYLQRFYSSFFSPFYKPEEVHVESSDTDRTLMTAQCVAAGLFSEHFGVTDRPQSVPWQPVPVHTLPRKFDKMLSPDWSCDYVNSLKYGLKAYFYSKQKIMKDKIMMFAFSEYSGLVMNFTTLQSLADTLFCQKVHNMSRPDWLKDTMEGQLFSFYHRLPVLMPEEAKYLAGILLETLIDNMIHKAENSMDKHKLYLYSAHQGNLHSLMSLLGVFHKDTTIPYASALIFELHKIHRKLFVRLLYKTTDTSIPELLYIPGCKSELCPLDALTDLHEEPAKKAWQDVCGLASPHENIIDFGENTIPILVAILAVFVCLDFFLLYKTFKYRQKLNLRDNKESYALVRTDAESSSDGDEDDDDFKEVEIEDSSHALLTKDHHDNRNHSSKRHKGVLNGGRKANRKRIKGKRSQIGRVSALDSDDSSEETSLFVSLPK